MKNFQACCAHVTLLATLLILSGCSKPGGGADSVVHVQPKSSNLSIFKEVEAPVDTNNGGPATKESGKPGTYSGQIVVTGSVSKKPDSKRTEKGCTLFPIPDESLLVGEGNGLANVFVYLAKAPKGASFDKTVPSQSISFINKGCRFLPHALIVRTGQKVHVTNEDTTSHNVNIEPTKNEKYNRLFPENDKVGASYVFEKSEAQPIAVKCDIHGWMKAYQLPLDHPYVALTDKNGHFEIKNLPPGKYRFKIWHESVGFIKSSHKVTVDGDQKETIEVSSDKLANANNVPSKIIYLSQLK